MVPPVVAQPAALFRKVHIDTFLMPKARGKDKVIHARCALSGWPEWRATGSESAAVIAEFIFQDVLCRWGAVEEIVTDNGSAFVAAVEVVKPSLKPLRLPGKPGSMSHLRYSGPNVLPSRDQRVDRPSKSRTVSNRCYHLTCWSQLSWRRYRVL